ncbi:hypothetical protein [Methylocella sp. CPCC 101449]|uniref:hypothetical protein n=1 Tax=Methylocella sp. CPCC 101449 TaxID=2987531 RepID=UPI002890B873|nr:hypothetical protein [Methylocella sp. CPCC 101449]MDT2024550.1 hypothetical protein [Methylocella sp. CPCC 101449]
MAKTSTSKSTATPDAAAARQEIAYPTLEIVVSPLSDQDQWQVARRHSGSTWTFDPPAGLREIFNQLLPQLVLPVSFTLVREVVDFSTFDPDSTCARDTVVLCREGELHRDRWTEFNILPNSGPLRPGDKAAFLDLRRKLDGLVPDLCRRLGTSSLSMTAFDLPQLARSDLWIRHEMTLADFFPIEGDDTEEAA